MNKITIKDLIKLYKEIHFNNTITLKQKEIASDKYEEAIKKYIKDK